MYNIFLSLIMENKMNKFMLIMDYQKSNVELKELERRMAIARFDNFITNSVGDKYILPPGTFIYIDKELRQDLKSVLNLFEVVLSLMDINVPVIVSKINGSAWKNLDK